MNALAQTLTTYGPLGVWVAYSIVRERWLLKKMEELSLRFESERARWDRERIKWLTILGRKGVVSDATIYEVTKDDHLP